jgi:phenylalanyl-tRNA synthetase alpha subunit
MNSSSPNVQQISRLTTLFDICKLYVSCITRLVVNLGKFKDILVEESDKYITRTFNSQDHLPEKLRKYLSEQGFNFRRGHYSFIEKQEYKINSLAFMGDHKHTSSALTYTITDLEESNKKLIIGTNTKYSFFELLKSSMLDGCDY